METPLSFVHFVVCVLDSDLLTDRRNTWSVVRWNTRQTAEESYCVANVLILVSRRFCVPLNHLSVHSGYWRSLSVCDQPGWCGARLSYTLVDAIDLLGCVLQHSH